MKTYMFDLSHGGKFFCNADSVEAAKGTFERSIGEFGVSANDLSTIQGREVSIDDLKKYFTTSTATIGKTKQTV